MTRIPCQYAIVRFAPFVETSEFANVGVIMMAARERYFGFKLETRRYARVTHFFEPMDAKLYKAALTDLREELFRIHDLLKTHGFDRRKTVNESDFAQHLFTEVIRKRESIIQFSEPRVVLTDNPKIKLDALFGHYVQRNFVTKQYRETVLDDGMRRWLHEVRADARFVREKIGDNEYQAIFPFVERHEEQAVKIIKPLHLGQVTPSKIIEHGAQWVFRVQELRRRRALPRKVLFAVDGPRGGDKRGNAYEHAVGMLEDAKVTILPYKDKKKVLDFVLDR